jgi:predicted DNA binding CopG/RHH family protein
VKNGTTFKTEDAERKYWATHSAAESLDALPAIEIEIVAPHRKREQLALPANDLDAIKKLAKRKGLPYQRLMRTWLQERLKNELSAR